MARSRGWSSAARRNAQKYAPVLRAMAKRPEEHLEEIFGTPDIGPGAIIGSFYNVDTQAALNSKMSWAWDWRNLIEKRNDLWPADRKSGSWDEVWRFYRVRFGQLSGAEKMLTRKTARTDVAPEGH